MDEKFANKNSEMRTKRNRETYIAFQNEINCYSQMMRTFLSHIRVCSVIVCLIFWLRHVETESRFAYAIPIASIFCVQLDFYAYYTQIFALTATAGQYVVDKGGRYVDGKGGLVVVGLLCGW